MMLQELISTFLIFTLFQITDGNTITIGKEAEIKCKELNKKCTPGNLCVIRHLQWPMNMSFPMCIPESEISGMLVQVKLRICQKPLDPGTCGARYVRWYFNTHIQKCTWFFWQGCQGNENNFKTQAECQAECLPHQNTNVIQKPLIYGLTGPVVVPQPLESPEYSNHIERGYPSVRSKPLNNQDKELRRKRRLEKRRQKRMRKLMRKRRKSMRGRKRRREGKVNKKGGKKRRKNKKKKNKKKGKRGKKKSKGEKTTIKLIPGKDDDITNTKDLVDKLVAQESLKEKKKNKKKESKS